MKMQGRRVCLGCVGWRHKIIKPLTHPPPSMCGAKPRHVAPRAHAPALSGTSAFSSTIQGWRRPCDTLMRLLGSLCSSRLCGWCVGKDKLVVEAGWHGANREQVGWTESLGHAELLVCKGWPCAPHHKILGGRRDLVPRLVVKVLQGASGQQAAKVEDGTAAACNEMARFRLASTAGSCRAQRGEPPA